MKKKTEYGIFCKQCDATSGHGWNKSEAKKVLETRARMEKITLGVPGSVPWWFQQHFGHECEIRKIDIDVEVWVQVASATHNTYVNGMSPKTLMCYFPGREDEARRAMEKLIDQGKIVVGTDLKMRAYYK